MDLSAKVRNTIQKYDMLSNGDAVLVAVSGGPDSMALLRLLRCFGEAMELRLEVAHLQHGIRGEEARRDALFVEAAAKQWGLPFHLVEIDLPRLKSARGKGNLEAMAREERYRFFLRVAEERGIRKIAVGHTRDDQVETLLMRLLRGSGRGGLGGMSPLRALNDVGKAGTWLIRPLIEVSREEVIEYLAAMGQEYRTDASNLDSALLRNWLRHHLLPQLREKIDSRLDERLARMAALLQGEEKALEQMAQERLGPLMSGEGLRWRSFLKEDRSMQLRMVRLWFREILGDLRSIDLCHFEAALRFITQGPPQGRLSLPGKWLLIKSYETVQLVNGEKQAGPLSYSYVFPVGEDLDIPEAGVAIHSSRLPSTAAPLPQDDLEACFDMAALPETLTVRNFRAGDRFQPLGMRGHKKVKDLFIEKKVAWATRSTLPLVLARDEIIWIPGYGRSEIAKIGPKTKEILRARLVRLCLGISKDTLLRSIC